MASSLRDAEPRTLASAGLPVSGKRMMAECGVESQQTQRRLGEKKHKNGELTGTANLQLSNS